MSRVLLIAIYSYYFIDLFYYLYKVAYSIIILFFKYYSIYLRLDRRDDYINKNSYYVLVLDSYVYSQVLYIESLELRIRLFYLFYLLY